MRAFPDELRILSDSDASNEGEGDFSVGKGDHGASDTMVQIFGRSCR